MRKPNLCSLISASTMALMLSLTSVPALVSASNYYEDEDTILVEKQPSQKIPYSKIVRKIGKRLFKVDTHKVFHLGKGKKSGVARTFSDFADRSKYRVNVRRDKVVLKFTMNF